MTAFSPNTRLAASIVQHTIRTTYSILSTHQSVCLATLPLAEATIPDSRQPSLSPLQESPTSQGNDTLCACPAIPTIDLPSLGQSTRCRFRPWKFSRACIPIPLEEISMASRISQTSLGENGKCRVFEAVLQHREATMCPFWLPAHARGVLRLVRETACIMCSNSFTWCASS